LISLLNARKIVTDSGGVPCITLRKNTEWVETVKAGANILTGAHTAKIVKAVKE
jgi:UDP-GlcNAc3NAcA epimerase